MCCECLCTLVIDKNTANYHLAQFAALHRSVLDKCWRPLAAESFVPGLGLTREAAAAVAEREPANDEVFGFVIWLKISRKISALNFTVFHPRKENQRKKINPHVVCASVYSGLVCVCFVCLSCEQQKKSGLICKIFHIRFRDFQPTNAP